MPGPGPADSSVASDTGWLVETRNSPYHCGPPDDAWTLGPVVAVAALDPARMRETSFQFWPQNSPRSAFKKKKRKLGLVIFNIYLYVFPIDFYILSI